MDIKIMKAKRKNIKDCIEALDNSDLGRQYFSSPGSAANVLKEGFAKKEIYIAINSQGEILGFLWYVKNAMFHSFPFLHIIAVKQPYRGMGIGKQMLDFFEKQCFAENSKVFLVVADFNPKAKALYKSMGYQHVGTIVSLYRDGISEHLMMKNRPEN